MSLGKRALAGLGAGVVLVGLKLIASGFFIGAPEAVRYVVWLAGFGTVAIVVILALFELFPSNPLGRLFWDSLTLPSLLFAIAAQTTLVPIGAPTGTIQKISARPADIVVTSKSFVPFAFAAPVPSTIGSMELVSLPADKLRGDRFDGIFIFLGRPPRSETFLYVVGTTPDPKRAFEVATSIRRIQDFIGEKSQIVRLEGRNQFFVTLGLLRTAQDALIAKERVQTKVVELLLDGSDKVAPEIAALLLKGTVVDARTLIVSSAKR